MENTSINSIDFIKSFKSIQPSTAQGANFVVESLKKLSNGELTNHRVSYVVESAKRSQDDSIKSWGQSWSDKTSSTKFKLEMIYESLAMRPMSSSNTALGEVISNLVPLEETALEAKIASNNVLSKWMLNPMVYEVVASAKKSFYTPEQKEFTVVSAKMPIGITVELNENELLTMFNGCSLVYNKLEDKLSVYTGSNDALIKIANVIASTEKYFNSEKDAYVFNTPIGDVTIDENGTKLAGDSLSLAGIVQIAGEYYKANQFNRGKIQDIKTLDNMIYAIQTIATNYGLINVISNVLYIPNGSGEYFVKLANKNAVVSKLTDSTGAFRIAITNFDSLKDAVAGLTDKQLKSELSETYASEIKAEADKEAGENSQRAELQTQLSAISNALILAKAHVEALDENFINKDKIAEIKAKIDTLEARKLEILEAIAKIGQIEIIATRVNESKEEDDTSKEALDAAIKALEDAQTSGDEESIKNAQAALDALKDATVNESIKIPMQKYPDGSTSDSYIIVDKISKKSKVLEIKIAKDEKEFEDTFNVGDIFDAEDFVSESKIPNFYDGQKSSDIKKEIELLKSALSKNKSEKWIADKIEFLESLVVNESKTDEEIAAEKEEADKSKEALDKATSDLEEAEKSGDEESIKNAKAALEALAKSAE